MLELSFFDFVINQPVFLDEVEILHHRIISLIGANLREGPDRLLACEIRVWELVRKLLLLLLNLVRQQRRLLQRARLLLWLVMRGLVLEKGLRRVLHLVLLLLHVILLELGEVLVGVVLQASDVLERLIAGRRNDRVVDHRVCLKHAGQGPDRHVGRVLVGVVHQHRVIVVAGVEPVARDQRPEHLLLRLLAWPGGHLVIQRHKWVRHRVGALLRQVGVHWAHEVLICGLAIRQHVELLGCDVDDSLMYELALPIGLIPAKLRIGPDSKLGLRIHHLIQRHQISLAQVGVGRLLRVRLLVFQVVVDAAAVLALAAILARFLGVLHLLLQQAVFDGGFGLQLKSGHVLPSCIDDHALRRGLLRAWE